MVGRFAVCGEAPGELPGGRNKDSRPAVGLREGLSGASKSGFLRGTKRPAPFLFISAVLLGGAFALELRGGANKESSSDGSVTDRDSSTRAGEGFGVVGGVERPPEMLVASGLEGKGTVSAADVGAGLKIFFEGGAKILGDNFVWFAVFFGGKNGPEDAGGENNPAIGPGAAQFGLVAGLAENNPIREREPALEEDCSPVGGGGFALGG